MQSTSAPVALTRICDQRSAAAHLVALGERDIALSTTMGLAIGDRVGVELSTRLGSITIFAAVRWCSRERVGLRVSGITPRDRFRLRRYMTTRESGELVGLAGLWCRPSAGRARTRRPLWLR